MFMLYSSSNSVLLHQCGKKILSALILCKLALKTKTNNESIITITVIQN